MFPFLFQTGCKAWKILQGQKQDGFKGGKAVKYCFCPCVLSSAPTNVVWKWLGEGDSTAGAAHPRWERLQCPQASVPWGKSPPKRGDSCVPCQLCPVSCWKASLAGVGVGSSFLPVQINLTSSCKLLSMTFQAEPALLCAPV